MPTCTEIAAPADQTLLVVCVSPRGLDAWAGSPPPGVESVRFDDLSAAMAWIDANGREPAVMLIHQDWPGQTPASQIDGVARRLPLTRLCALLDSWCEGEVRSGRPWPAALRVYEHQFPARALRELRLLVRGQTAAWAQPVTSGSEQRLLAEHPARDNNRSKCLGQQRPAGSLAVVAMAAEAAAALADAASAVGYRVASVRQTRGVWLKDVDAVVWDTTAPVAADARAIADLRTSFGAVPIVAVLGFPRTDEIASARRAGVAAVLSKPFLLEDFRWQLAAATAGCA